MSGISDELAAIAAELTAAGIPTTTDPAQIWALAAQSDAAALLGRIENVHLVNLKPRIRFTVPVQLVSRGPDSMAEPRLLAALPTVLQVLRPLEAASPDQLIQDDAGMPTYRIPATRDIPLTEGT